MKQIIGLQGLKPHAEGHLGVILKALGVNSPIVTPQVKGKADCVVDGDLDIKRICSTLRDNGYNIREIKHYQTPQI